MQIGHGYSGGDRIYVEDFGDYTKDYLAYVDFVTEKLSKENKDTLPRFLIGHSMGGTISLQTALAKQDLVCITL